MAAAPRENVVLAILESEEALTVSIAELRRAGIDLARVSALGKRRDAGMRVTGCYGTGNGRAKCWGDSGEFWEGVWETLSGWGFFVVPGIGPVLVAGPLAGWIVAGLENETIFGGLSAIGAGLYSIGISRDRIPLYEAALRAGHYLGLVHGTAAEVTRARDVLAALQPASRL